MGACVTLTLTGPDGQPVRDVNGVEIAPVVTDADGAYVFTDVPTLPAGEHYTVTLDGAAASLAGLSPTANDAGDDRTVDSSTGSSVVAELTTDGDADTTIDFGFVRGTVSVGDFVWNDRDRDGVQDAGEPGIAGVTLTITGPDGTPVVDVNGAAVGPVVTDANGHYAFTLLPTLPAGQSYTVTVDTASPALTLYVQTSPAGGPASDTADLTQAGDADLTMDFGFAHAAVTVGDHVWLDANRNGVQDAGERGIPGVRLTITGPDGTAVIDVLGNPVGAVTTDADGHYVFTDLPALPAGQSYTVTVDTSSLTLAGLVPTEAGVGAADTDSSTGTASSADLDRDGASDTSLDFGFAEPVVLPVDPDALPATGLQLAPWMLIAALAALVLGAWLLVRGRRGTKRDAGE